MKYQHLTHSRLLRSVNLLLGCTVSELFVLATIAILLVGMAASISR